MGLVRLRCSTCLCRIMKAKCVTAAVDEWSMGTKHVCLMTETCGFEAIAPHVVTGRIWKPLRRRLSTVGFAPEISIAAMKMGIGFTWDAAMIVSNRAVSGFRRLKWKLFCCDTLG